jgi:RNA polymerase sigma-70 factor (ECF subfamily)
VTSSDGQTSDEDLLRRYGEGDPRAFEALLARYEQPVFNFILRSVRRRDLAEELFQETFVRVAQRWTDLKGTARFTSWLYSIARNLCVDHSRRMVFRRHPSLDGPTREPGEEEAVSLLDRAADAAPGVERRVIASDLSSRITTAVEDLPEEQREVFLMRELQGLAFKDIAEIVGVSESTAKSRMRYALERLQRALDDYRDYADELERSV